MFVCLVGWLVGGSVGGSVLVAWLVGWLFLFLSSSLTRDARRASGADTGGQLAGQNTSCTLHGSLKAPTFTAPSARLCRTLVSASTHLPQDARCLPIAWGCLRFSIRRESCVTKTCCGCGLSRIRDVKGRVLIRSSPPTAASVPTRRGHSTHTAAIPHR